MLSKEKLIDLMFKVQTTRDISLGVIAKESGISESTLSRMKCHPELGVDFDNLAKLSQWLGYKTMFDAGTVCDGNTLPNIKEVIFNDKVLDESAKEKLWYIFVANFNAWTEIAK